MSYLFVILALVGCSGSTVAQQPAGRSVDPPASQPASGTWAKPAAPAAPAASVDSPPANQGIARMTPKPTAAAPAAAASIMYIKSADTVVRQATTLSSPAVAKLQPGDQVTVSERGTLQWKVRTTSGVTGYVSKLNLSDVPPAAKSGGRGLPIEIASSGPSDRDNINVQRGLSAETKGAAKQSNLPEEAIEDATTMEQTAAKFSNADLDLFLKEGQVFAQ
ncbi:MAG: SH3 domain-containing protein [Candidatus Sumerlaeota bacterium]